MYFSFELQYFKFQSGCRGEVSKILSFRDEYLRKNADPFSIFQCDIVLVDMGLNVAPEFQGYGIGYTMFSCLSTLAKCFHIPAILTSITNPNVQKFAETLGYKTYADFVYSEHRNSDGKLIIPVEDAHSCKSMGMKF